jgi:predicted Fe-Mo cluster-binding NifX family protein
MGKKIAVVTENGQDISSHFGMAPFFHVFDVEEGKILKQEVRAKAYHAQHPQHNHDEHEGHGGHHLHADMFSPLSDCQVLLAGGMGEPAYRKALDAGLEVVLVGGNIQDIVQAYLHGEVQSDQRRIHRH